MRETPAVRGESSAFAESMASVRAEQALPLLYRIAVHTLHLFSFDHPSPPHYAPRSSPDELHLDSDMKLAGGTVLFAPK